MINMKGMTVIEVLILIVLGMLVLLALTGTFFGVWQPASGGTSLQSATETACLKLRTTGCTDWTGLENFFVDNFDANGDGEINPGRAGEPGCATNEECDNLYTLCVNHYGCVWTTRPEFFSCCGVNVCGCPAYV